MQSAKLFGSILRQGAIPKRSMAKVDASMYKHVTLNDLPTPQGNWKTVYDAKQRKYNAHLAIGIGFSIFTIIVMKTSGLINFNFNVPDRPADRE